MSNLYELIRIKDRIENRIKELERDEQECPQKYNKIVLEELKRLLEGGNNATTK